MCFDYTHGLELCHQYGIGGTFAAFVSKPSAATLPCLLYVVGCQEAVDDRYVLRGVEVGDAIGDTLAYIVEMRSLATYDAAKDYDGIEAVVLAQLLRAVDELETARHVLDVYVFRQCPVLLKGVNSSLEQRAGYLLIPIGNHYAEVHVRGIGYDYAVVGIVMKLGSHVTS